MKLYDTSNILFYFIRGSLKWKQNLGLWGKIWERGGGERKGRAIVVAEDDENEPCACSARATIYSSISSCREGVLVVNGSSSSMTIIYYDLSRNHRPCRVWSGKLRGWKKIPSVPCSHPWKSKYIIFHFNLIRFLKKILWFCFILCFVLFYEKEKLSRLFIYIYI